MSDPRNNRWKRETTSLEPREVASSFDAGDDRRRPDVEPREASSSFDADDQRRPNAPPVRRLSQHASASKVKRLKDNVQLARQDCLELRREASELREYSDAELGRVARYLGVLADETWILDRVAVEGEARVATLESEKKKLFFRLWTSEGNIKVFCRSRPLFEDEGPSAVEFPDDLTIRVSTGDETSTNPKKDYEFDRVYGPHVGQAEIFSDVQPLVQSALDGFNVSIFAYGQSNSGKMHTMEGSSHDHGLYVRCFEELFDLANSDATATSRYDFSVTVFELHNGQVRDLVRESGRNSLKICMGSSGFFLELTQEKVDNPLDFLKVLKEAFQSRGNDVLKFNVSHLIVTIHISYNNLITRENLYSKLSLVDLAGSEGLNVEDGSGERVTELLHVMKSLSALGDVLSSLASKKYIVPYQNSTLTRLLADSLGGSSKTLLIVNVSPDASNVSETLSSLNFASRARNAMLSLGNRETIKKWREVANDARKELYEKGRELQDAKQQVLGLKQALKDVNDRHVLFNEGQKAWKVSYTLQSNLKSENIMLADKHKIQKEQNAQLRNKLAQLVQLERDRKLQIQRQNSTIQSLQAKIRSLEHQLNDALHSSETKSKSAVDSGLEVQSLPKAVSDTMDSSIVTKKLEEELKKFDALIEISSPLSEGIANMPSRTNNNIVGHTLDVVPWPLTAEKSPGSVAPVRTSSEKVKTMPEGEYLTEALNDFDREMYESIAAISDGANKLLMLVLAAVIKAGASREHEILAEIRDAVFRFIRKMELWGVMDTVLVSHVWILYIRSLLARSPELQSIKVSPVDCFLEKANSGRSRSSSQDNSRGRSSVRYVEEQIQGFKVNIKPEKKFKFCSVVLKLQGIDQETQWQHYTSGKLREITEEAKSFSTGNKSLAALFVHTPAGELQQHIKSWLAENFEFLSVTGDDAMRGTTGQLENFSTAIMDGWMAGLGTAVFPNTDALGQLLSEYAKRVYTSQLQHLKDIAGTLATEEAEDLAHVAKLRSALESVVYKRRQILQQMRSYVALLTLEDGGSPICNSSTAAEDARLASLVSLDGILKQVKDIMRQSAVNTLSRSKKAAMLASLDELAERMPSLLDIDHPCAQKQISDAGSAVESIPEEDEQEQLHASGPADSGPAVDTDVAQWNVLQINIGSMTPFIIKCGANSNSELVIKAGARVQEPKGGEIVRVVPRPSVLENMSLEEMKQLFSQIPEALGLLALTPTADGTRAQYSRLYGTLAMTVPSLRNI